MAIVEQPAPRTWAPTPVPPHTYPLWVVAAAVVSVLAALYSFSQVQTLIDATADLRSGQRAIAVRDYTDAVVPLEVGHEALPSSRKITIELATAEFGTGNEQAALGLIAGMRFSRSEWSTLTQTMPLKIQAQYHLTK